MWQKFKALFGAQDMTVGNPSKALLKFALPMLLGNIAQLLYSTVDSIIVGKYVGDLALGAIGVSGPIVNMFLILFMAVGTGVTVMVAQYFGAKDFEKLGTSIGNSITLILISVIVITGAGIPLSAPLLRITNTTADIFDMAHAYLVIMFIGAFGNGFYNIISGILRGLGESVFPLLVLLGTTVVNIVLDLLFVCVFDMGVAGAAWATIIAQTLSALVCLIKLFMMKDIVKLNLKMLKPVGFYTKKIIVLGLPSGIAQGILFVSILFVQSLINSMGSMVVATTTAVMRVDSFAMLPCQTFSMAASTFTGQNMGANRMDRVRKGTKAVVLMSLVASVTLVTLLLIFGKFALGWFTETQAVIDLGYRMICIMSVAYVVMAFMQGFSGVMRGAGDTMASMWITLCINVVVRIPTAYILAHFTKSPEWPTGSPDAIYGSMVVAWVVGAIITIAYYCTGRWKKKALVKVTEE